MLHIIYFSEKVESKRTLLPNTSGPDKGSRHTIYQSDSDRTHWLLFLGGRPQDTYEKELPFKLKGGLKRKKGSSIDKKIK